VIINTKTLCGMPINEVGATYLHISIKEGMVMG
jgi:hypothetical protein